MSEDGQITEADRAQLDAKYAELEKFFKDHNVHDICLKTMAMLLGPDGVTFRDQWTPEIATAWWVELEAAKTARSHKKAIDDLIMLQHYMRKKLNKPDLANALLVLLNEAVIRYQLVSVDVDAQFDEKAAGQGDTKVTGVKDRPVPAMVGDKAPAGTVRPDQLGKPRRL